MVLALLSAQIPAKCPGKLYLGDNLDVMHQLLQKGGLLGAVDLVYINPPFATNNVLGIDDSRADTISAKGCIAYRDKLTGETFWICTDGL